MHSLNTKILKPLSKKNPKKIVVLCHGFGGNGKSIALLANFWRSKLKDTIFLCPNAPNKCQNEKDKFQWFSPEEKNKKKLLIEINKSAKKLNKFIDKVLLDYSLTENDLILAGFSQGCMLVLESGLMRKKKVKAIIGYSGKIVDQPSILSKIKSKPNIYLFHGEKDTIVLPRDFFETKKFLKDNNFHINSKLFKNCDHKIPTEGAKLGLDFIKNNL